MKTSEAPSYMTTREACDHLGYARPDSFLGAWRAAELPVYKRPGAHCLVNRDDLGRFLRRSDRDAATEACV